jgi:NTE family protein
MHLPSPPAGQSVVFFSDRVRLDDLRSRRIGLALSSGSARGFAHLAVLETLRKWDIVPFCIAGCSAGALMGAVYCAGRIEEYMDRIRSWTWKDTLAMLDPTLPTSGFLGGEKLLAMNREYLDRELLEECTPPLAVVAADCLTGEEVVLRRGRILDAVRGSVAIPGLFTPARVSGRLLVDGGLVNPLPVSACRDMGADLVIAVDANTLFLNEKNKSSRLASPLSRAQEKILRSWIRALNPGYSFLGSLLENWLARQKRSTPPDPSIVEILLSSIGIMQTSIQEARMCMDPPDLLLRLPLAGIRLLDFHLGDRALRLGEQTTKAMLETLKP